MSVRIAQDMEMTVMETVTRRCDNCARGKFIDRDLLPIKCTLHGCWTECDYICDKWVEKESDGYITVLRSDDGGNCKRSL